MTKMRKMLDKGKDIEGVPETAPTHLSLGTGGTGTGSTGTGSTGIQVVVEKRVVVTKEMVLSHKMKMERNEIRQIQLYERGHLVSGRVRKRFQKQIWRVQQFVRDVT